MSRARAAQPAWVETEATVTSCRFQFARLNTFTMGLPTTKKYRITFDYRAHGKTYSDEFQSAVAVPQNGHMTLLYNPLAPEENNLSRAGASRATQPSLFAIGIAGSVVLSLLWLLVLHGCR